MVFHMDLRREMPQEPSVLSSPRPGGAAGAFSALLSREAEEGERGGRPRFPPERGRAEQLLSIKPSTAQPQPSSRDRGM